MQKINWPKLKIQLPAVLFVVLGIAIAAEAFVLYKYLYVGIHMADSGRAAVPEPDSVKIDLKSFSVTAAWIKAGQSYRKPDYSLRAGAAGRENAFEEYR